MENRIKILAAFCLLGITSNGLGAQANTADMQQLLQRTQTLEKELQSMQTELNVLRKEEAKKAQPTLVATSSSSRDKRRKGKQGVVENSSSASRAVSTEATSALPQPSAPAGLKKQQPAASQWATPTTHKSNPKPGPVFSSPRYEQVTQAVIQQDQVPTPGPGTSLTVAAKRLLEEHTPQWIYTEGTPVISAPYIGTHSEFDGSALIVNFSKINEDLRLLQQRQKMDNRIHELGYEEPTNPLILVTGKIEALITGQSPFQGFTQGNFSLGSSELEFAILMNSWVTGLLSIDYDGAVPPPILSSDQLGNSRIFLDKAIVTLGNLNRFPLWFSIGQFYVPFGRYSSGMVNPPLTLLLARTHARAVVLGYHQPQATSPYVQVYAFNGNAVTQSPGNINQVGTDLGYVLNNDKWQIDFGGGAIANMADSSGMQLTGDPAANAFPGYSVPALLQGTATNIVIPATREILVHGVPGADGHISVGYGDWVFIGEYITAVRRFDPLNLMFDGEGAKPAALNAELDYSFKLGPFPTTAAIGYQQTADSLALFLPQRRYTSVINVALWKDTIASLEYRHDINYPTDSTSSGTLSPVKTINDDPNLGKSDDVVTAQLGIYF